jgi:predicted transcriptional regulator of viral defense system
MAERVRSASLDVPRLAARLRREASIVAVPGVPGVYLVTAAFADLLPVSDEQIVQEAHPAAVFSHLTALVSHALTDQLPAGITITEYSGGEATRIPLGTTPEEWHDHPYPVGRRTRQVGRVPVHWFKTRGEWDFGHQVGYSQGQPIYVTDLERTLLDALRSPAEVGGPALMLRAWKQAGPSLNVDRLVTYADRFGQPVLRQRVGYLLGQLGRDHPRLAGWRADLRRGGSLRLVASEPYSATHSPEWNLSLNVPPAVLAELH